MPVTTRVKVPKFPPSVPAPQEIVLSRRPRAKFVVIYLPDKQSYKLTAEDAETYLKMLGCQDPWYVVTVVWNFYAAHYNVATDKVLIIPRATVDEVFPGRKLTVPTVLVGTGGKSRWSPLEFWRKLTPLSLQRHR